MNKQDVCRQIAIKLEAEPKYPDGLYYEVHSLKGFWIRHSFNVELPDVEPFNPFDSEDDSAGLLEAMPNAELENRGDKWEARYGWESGYYHHSDRRTAIVLAACAWLGIEYE